jgi:cytochrome c peroxidase
MQIVLPSRTRNGNNCSGALFLLSVLGFFGAHVAAALTERPLPLGLPQIAAEIDLHQRDQLAPLGRMLFEDSRLSADRKTSCSTCHQVKRAFSDGRAHAVNAGGRKGTRNTPSLLNVAYAKDLLWDGRLTSLEEQVRAPLFNPIEQGLSDERMLERILSSLPEYTVTFRKAFGATGHSPTTDQVAKAIAAYERTLLSADSQFDRFLYGHEVGALSVRAQRGLALFRGRGGCSTCHPIGDSAALLTDRQFHESSIRLDAAVLEQLPTLIARIRALRTQSSLKSLNDLVTSDPKVAALGRFVSTGEPADIGKFRTPSLRNVALTAPYMHDGSVRTLESAVELELYGREAGVAKPIVLTADERADIVEFLRALDSSKAHDAAR